MEIEEYTIKVLDFEGFFSLTPHKLPMSVLHAALNIKRLA